MFEVILVVAAYAIIAPIVFYIGLFLAAFVNNIKKKIQGHESLDGRSGINAFFQDVFNDANTNCHYIIDKCVLFCSRIINFLKTPVTIVKIKLVSFGLAIINFFKTVFYIVKTIIIGFLHLCVSTGKFIINIPFGVTNYIYYLIVHRIINPINNLITHIGTNVRESRIFKSIRHFMDSLPLVIPALGRFLHPANLVHMLFTIIFKVVKNVVQHRSRRNNGQQIVNDNIEKNRSDEYNDLLNGYDKIRRNFETYVENSLNNTTENKKKFNILLLGQTGAGKSTLINSIANYFTYSTFQEALDVNKAVCLVSTRFELHPNDGDIIIEKNGLNEWDTNEHHHNEAESCTQDPRVYEFIGENTEYHIIDVPGIADTRGVIKDDRNKLAILKKLKEFEILHGIFIVLNSTCGRLTSEIENNYNEILMEFHKNATPNIMFILTYSRTSNFTPGDALGPLRTYVKELKNRGIIIELSDKSVFCVDNEGYRYQCGVENERFKALFGPEVAVYERSWNKSRNAIFNAFNIIETYPGHCVMESIEVSEARIMIQALMGPLARVYTIIQKDMSKKMKEAQILSIMNTGNLLQRMTTIEKLKYPRCVCLYCAQTIKLETNEIQINFNQICHEECVLANSVPDKFPEPNMKNCTVFDTSGYCEKCGCHYLKHIRISQNISQKIVPQSKLSTITRNVAEGVYGTLHCTLVREQHWIWNSIIQLTHFLKNNAVVNFNEQFEDKLKKEIELEMITNANSDVVKHLKRRLKDYQEEIAMMRYALKRNNVSSANVTEIKNLLFNLKINGKLIEKLYNANCSDLVSAEHAENIKYYIIHAP